ncbi:MAG TPA: hypothetical protein ENH20_00835 [Candidatus Pacearchaeota archaeon]|nr:hypothetical protein [Candidatus Pacearchaeota archaeon]
MDKKGGVGVVILVILGVLLILGVGAGVYFYNYYVFKEVWVCVGDAENLMLPCEVVDDCLDRFGYGDKLDDVPGFMKNYGLDIINEAVFCNETCFVREVRGFDFESGEIGVLDSCIDGEKEFVLEIRGKEGWEGLEWIRGRESS